MLEKTDACPFGSHTDASAGAPDQTASRTRLSCFKIWTMTLELPVPPQGSKSGAVISDTVRTNSTAGSSSLAQPFGS